MTNIDQMIPLWFVSKFGGSIKRRTYPRGGRGRTGAEFTPNWAWSLHCRKAADFLELILPYLKTKQYRASLAIQLARKARPRGLQDWKGGYIPLTAEEIRERARLAKQIRDENRRTNLRVQMVAKPIEVN